MKKPHDLSFTQLRAAPQLLDLSLLKNPIQWGDADTWRHCPCCHNIIERVFRPGVPTPTLVEVCRGGPTWRDIHGYPPYFGSCRHPDVPLRIEWGYIVPERVQLDDTDSTQIVVLSGKYRRKLVQVIVVPSLPGKAKTGPETWTPWIQFEIVRTFLRMGYAPPLGLCTPQKIPALPTQIHRGDAGLRQFEQDRWFNKREIRRLLRGMKRSLKAGRDNFGLMIQYLTQLEEKAA